ncbi:hypothetical protein DIPPA_13946 [Diplonema papillatum]|nr:hypothetical protein DIPPA_13946 [Diplonema papillatum]
MLDDASAVVSDGETASSEGDHLSKAEEESLGPEKPLDLSGSSLWLSPRRAPDFDLDFNDAGRSEPPKATAHSNPDTPTPSSERRRSLPPLHHRLHASDASQTASLSPHKSLGAIKPLISRRFRSPTSETPPSDAPFAPADPSLLANRHHQQQPSPALALGLDDRAAAPAAADAKMRPRGLPRQGNAGTAVIRSNLSFRAPQPVASPAALARVRATSSEPVQGAPRHQQALGGNGPGAVVLPSSSAASRCTPPCAPGGGGAGALDPTRGVVQKRERSTPLRMDDGELDDMAAIVARRQSSRTRCRSLEARMADPADVVVGRLSSRGSSLGSVTPGAQPLEIKGIVPHGLGRMATTSPSPSGLPGGRRASSRAAAASRLPTSSERRPSEHRGTTTMQPQGATRSDSFCTGSTPDSLSLGRTESDGKARLWSPDVSSLENTQPQQQAGLAKDRPKRRPPCDSAFAPWALDPNDEGLPATLGTAQDPTRSASDESDDKKMAGPAPPAPGSRKAGEAASTDGFPTPPQNVLSSVRTAGIGQPTPSALPLGSGQPGSACKSPNAAGTQSSGGARCRGLEGIDAVPTPSEDVFGSANTVLLESRRDTMEPAALAHSCSDSEGQSSLNSLALEETTRRALAKRRKAPPNARRTRRPSGPGVTVSRKNSEMSGWGTPQQRSVPGKGLPAGDAALARAKRKMKELDAGKAECKAAAAAERRRADAAQRELERCVYEADKTVSGEEQLHAKVRFHSRRAELLATVAQARAAERSLVEEWREKKATLALTDEEETAWRLLAFRRRSTPVSELLEIERKRRPSTRGAEHSPVASHRQRQEAEQAALETAAKQKIKERARLLPFMNDEVARARADVARAERSAGGGRGGRPDSPEPAGKRAGAAPGEQECGGAEAAALAAATARLREVEQKWAELVPELSAEEEAVYRGCKARRKEEAAAMRRKSAESQAHRVLEAKVLYASRPGDSTDEVRSVVKAKALLAEQAQLHWAYYTAMAAASTKCWDRAAKTVKHTLSLSPGPADGAVRLRALTLGMRLKENQQGYLQSVEAAGAARKAHEKLAEMSAEERIVLRTAKAADIVRKQRRVTDSDAAAIREFAEALAATARDYTADRRAGSPPAGPGLGPGPLLLTPPPLPSDMRPSATVQSLCAFLTSDRASAASSDGSPPRSPRSPRRISPTSSTAASSLCSSPRRVGSFSLGSARSSFLRPPVFSLLPFEETCCYHWEEPGGRTADLLLELQACYDEARAKQETREAMAAATVALAACCCLGDRARHRIQSSQTRGAAADEDNARRDLVVEATIPESSKPSALSGVLQSVDGVVMVEQNGGPVDVGEAAEMEEEGSLGGEAPFFGASFADPKLFFAEPSRPRRAGSSFPSGGAHRRPSSRPGDSGASRATGSADPDSTSVSPHQRAVIARRQSLRKPSGR